MTLTNERLSEIEASPREAYIMKSEAKELVDAYRERSGLTTADALAPEAGAVAPQVAVIAQLRDALTALRDECKANPAMQGRQYVSLGIQVQNALDAAARPAPRQEPAAPTNCRDAGGRPTCIECAQGNYERCLWNRRAAPQDGSKAPAADPLTREAALHAAKCRSWAAKTYNESPDAALCVEAGDRLLYAAQLLDALSATPSSDAVEPARVVAAAQGAAPALQPTGNECVSWEFCGGSDKQFMHISMGHGRIEVGDGQHLGLPALWFGNDGQGLGIERDRNEQAKPGESLVIFTFANLQGLEAIEFAVARVRKNMEAAAPTREAHEAASQGATAPAAPTSDWTLEDVGRAMVEMTTTVRGPDEWAAIPDLWRLCAEERDRLRVEHIPAPTGLEIAVTPTRLPKSAFADAKPLVGFDYGSDLLHVMIFDFGDEGGAVGIWKEGDEFCARITLDALAEFWLRAKANAAIGKAAATEQQAPGAETP